MAFLSPIRFVTRVYVSVMCSQYSRVYSWFNISVSNQYGIKASLRSGYWKPPNIFSRISKNPPIQEDSWVSKILEGHWNVDVISCPASPSISSEVDGDLPGTEPALRCTDSVPGKNSLWQPKSGQADQLAIFSCRQPGPPTVLWKKCLIK